LQLKPRSSAPKKSAARKHGEACDKGRVLKLSTFLPYRLSVVAAVASEGLARIYSEQFGIAIPEWRILATVGEFRSISAKAIGLHAHMDKVKVSRAAVSLEARGFIRRLPNPDDLREAFLVLTPAGQTVYDKIVPMALDYVERLTSNLSSEEEAALNGLIGRLLSNAQQIAGDPSATRQGARHSASS
jgi:DNA-binding MarR family transcriptional regulator